MNHLTPRWERLLDWKEHLGDVSLLTLAEALHLQGLARGMEEFEAEVDDETKSLQD